MKWQKVSRNLIRETKALGFYPISYNRLIELFGEPDKGKTPINAEWVIQFQRENGEQDVVIIQHYDYEKPIEDIRRWHVRGYFEDSVLRFDELIKSSTLGDKLNEAYTFLHLAIHEKSGDDREGLLLDGLSSLEEAIDLFEKEKCDE